MSIWIILIILLAVLAFLTHPSLNFHKARRWRGQQFAHRGLHDLDRGIVENTLPAFEAARDAGYGMELDIQFSKDMQVVVFHDNDLLRLCGDSRKVCQLTLAELRALPLAGREDARIPTLREVLDLVNGRAPLLIELKSGPRNAQLCQALVEHLKGYRGAYVVESFNPLIVGWFRRHAPEVVRGQLVCPMHNYIAKASRVSALFMSGLMLNCIGRPDFVAYDANAPRFFAPHLQRFLYRTPMAAWTVRDDRLEQVVQSRREMSIFERIRP